MESEQQKSQLFVDFKTLNAIKDSNDTRYSAFFAELWPTATSMPDDILTLPEVAGAPKVAKNMRIPTKAGRVFQPEAGRHSDLKPATCGTEEHPGQQLRHDDLSQT